MKNENKMDDMVDILTHMHRYVPLHAVSKTVEVPGTEGSDRVQVERLHQILIGGDQLTAERVKGAQSLRRNSTHATGRLQGFVPVSEDWHAKVCFLEVGINYLKIYLTFTPIGYMEAPRWKGTFVHRAWNTLTTQSTHKSNKCSNDTKEKRQCIGRLFAGI